MFKPKLTSFFPAAIYLVADTLYSCWILKQRKERMKHFDVLFRINYCINMRCDHQRDCSRSIEQEPSFSYLIIHILATWSRNPSISWWCVCSPKPYVKGLCYYVAVFLHCKHLAMTELTPWSQCPTQISLSTQRPFGRDASGNIGDQHRPCLTRAKHVADQISTNTDVNKRNLR